MNEDIKIIENAIKNTINNNAPRIEWGFNDKLKINNNIDNILQNIILLFLCWSFIGIIISIYMKKNKILSILLGPLILFK